METTNPIRVVFNTKPFLFRKTGIGYYTFNLLNGLMRSKDVVVFQTIDNPSTKTLRFMSSASERIRKVLGNSILRLTIPVGDFLISRRERANKVNEADVYHETNYDIIPEGQWKSIATIHDLAFVKCPEHLPKDVVLKCRASLANVSRADRFIVTTEAIRKELVEFSGVSEERIDVIPLAPSGKYYPIDKDLKENRKVVDKYAKGRYILYVGTIEPRKNIKTLIKAYRIIRDKHDIKLVLAGGKGWMYEDILKMPLELGIKDDVVFTGYIDEETMLHLYNFASVFVYPSVYEGFGIPVVEAMSCGLPVVVSDIPSLREVAGDAALSFKHDDHEELAHRISQILSSEHLAGELRGKSLRRAGEFSWEKTVAGTIRTYKKALPT